MATETIHAVEEVVQTNTNSFFTEGVPLEIVSRLKSNPSPKCTLCWSSLNKGLPWTTREQVTNQVQAL